NSPAREAPSPDGVRRLGEGPGDRGRHRDGDRRGRREERRTVARAGGRRALSCLWAAARTRGGRSRLLFHGRRAAGAGARRPPRGDTETRLTLPGADRLRAAAGVPPRARVACGGGSAHRTPPTLLRDGGPPVPRGRGGGANGLLGRDSKQMD